MVKVLGVDEIYSAKTTGDYSAFEAACSFDCGESDLPFLLTGILVMSFDVEVDEMEDDFDDNVV